MPIVYDPDKPPPPLEALHPAGLAAKRERCKRSLGDFVQQAWPVIEASTPLVWNWYLDVICDHVQAIVEGKRPDDKDRKLPRTGLQKSWTQNAILNVPPGAMKTLITQVFMPAWKWLQKPGWRVLCFSGTPEVLRTASLKCRDVITSNWYTHLFAPAWTISADQNEKLNYKNTKGGVRTALSVGSAVTGVRADCLVIDDPQDAQGVLSKIERQNVNDWWDLAANNRVNDEVRSTRLVIMQRLHVDDFTGHLLEVEKLREDGGTWEQVVIPTEFEPGEVSTKKTWLGWTDPRKSAGELLDEDRWPAVKLAEYKKNAARYAGQYQQRPAPLEGNLFKKEHWRFWKEDGMPDTQPRPKGCTAASAIVLPTAFHEIAESWDLTFKGKVSNDWVVGVKIGRVGARKFILNFRRLHTGFGGAKAAILDMRSHEPWCSKTWVEDKANGPAVIEELQSVLSGLIAINPEGGKESRANVMQPQVEAGEWFLPDGAPFLDQFIEEFSVFPNGRHDDCVDACSQAAVKMSGSSDLAYALAMCGK